MTRAQQTKNCLSMRASLYTRIDSALGVFDRPGMVMMSPASGTTKPAPAGRVT
mgnify:CR=1 FL=1